MTTSEIERRLSEEIAEGKASDEILLLWDAAKLKEAEASFTRYPIGIAEFDSVAKLREEDQGGISAGDLLIIAAPTGNGKTTLATTISYNLLKINGMPSLWFTYEVSVYALWRIFEKMGARKDDFFCVPADHTTGKLEWVEKKIKEAKEKFSIGSVVIDHLGFLAPLQKMNNNMTQNYSSYLGQICRELKTIAVKENISIILPVHMVKSATDDPSLRDIGHSGGIAQEADFVILMAREESTEAGKKTKLSYDMGKDYYTERTKITLAKNRIGGVTPSWWLRMQDGKLVTSYGEDNPNKDESKWKSTFQS